MNNIKQWEELDDSWKCFFDISTARYHIAKATQLCLADSRSIVNINELYFRRYYYYPNALLSEKYSDHAVVVTVFKSLLIHLSTKVSYLEPNLVTLKSKIFMR